MPPKTLDELQELRMAAVKEREEAEELEAQGKAEIVGFHVALLEFLISKGLATKDDVCTISARMKEFAGALLSLVDGYRMLATWDAEAPSNEVATEEAEKLMAAADVVRQSPALAVLPDAERMEEAFAEMPRMFQKAKDDGELGE